jgi:hypothetical protein
MSLKGFSQERKYDRIFHLSGTRVFTADRLTAIPDPTSELNSEPSGWFDHGTIVGGIVNINVELTRESVDVGRIPTADRFYLSAQRGTIEFRMQEYQPENISLASGGDGTLVPDGNGNDRVLMGGELPVERALLLVDDFDPTAKASANEPWAQYLYYTPNAQGGGTFTRGEEKAYWVIPATYDLLRHVIDDINRLLQFYPIEQ